MFPLCIKNEWFWSFILCTFLHLKYIFCTFKQIISITLLNEKINSWQNLSPVLVPSLCMSVLCVCIQKSNPKNYVSSRIYISWDQVKRQRNLAHSQCICTLRLKQEKSYDWVEGNDRSTVPPCEQRSRCMMQCTWFQSPNFFQLHTISQLIFQRS